ncbi:LysM peptidoglycan-binding domain-containing protein [Micromonospora sp. CPCC 205539]|uniref:LysM peptidoglycan-binding domain-containing protein n=1 Tax=Micromonospora sp. CPCC 205539 TaxID=3122408 RepID=UPI002FF092C2
MAAPLSPQIIAVLICAAAVALWLLLATAVLSHAYAALARRARWTVTIRLPGPIRSLAAALLGASAVTTATGVSAHAAPAASSADLPTAEPVSTAATSLSTHRTSVTPQAGHQGVPTHTVRRGDTLSKIAERCLGDGNRWPEIFKLNRGTHFANVGGTLRNPDLIFPGWVLTMPTAGTPPETTPPRNPATKVPPQESPAPPTTNPTTTPGTTPHATPPAVAPGASATSSAETPRPPTGDDGVFVPPSPSVTAPPASDAAGPATPSIAPSPSTADRKDATTLPPRSADDRPSSSPRGWVDIAGGAMGVGLAAALVYAVTMVWRRRRHRYRPTPITGPVLADADLTSPLAALTRLRHGVRRAAPHLLDRSPDRGPTVREYIAAEVKPPLSASGTSGAELAGVDALPVTAGLGLDGPAALDAARALLVATLTSGDTDDPGAQGRVVIPAATLATLLGVSAVDRNPMQRLAVTPTFAAALTLLEEEVIRRSRIAADREAAALFGQDEDWTYERLPQLLLIADIPDESWHPRLATAIRLGASVDIGAAVIGSWVDGTTLTVAADGTTAGGDGERVAVLDTAATANILTMLAEAHGDTEPPTPAPSPAAGQAKPPTTSLRRGDDNDPAEPERQGPPQQTRAPEYGAIPPGSGIAAPRVRARVLGEPAILDTDGMPVRGLRAKSLELFVYLVVHRGGASLGDIMEAIWPDVTVSRASERLSTCAANLRTTIRSTAQTSTALNEDTPKIEPVINTGGRYHLDPNLLDVDWWTVEDAYARVATAVDDADRLAHLHAAMAAASGGLADGSTYEWIDTDREHARRRLVKMYAQAAGLHVGSDPAAALALYDRARALDPLSDELTRRAMRTAARLGDAVGVRERLVALRRELVDAGIDIDSDTEDLATGLLHGLANP